MCHDTCYICHVDKTIAIGVTQSKVLNRQRRSRIIGIDRLAGLIHNGSQHHVLDGDRAFSDGCCLGNVKGDRQHFATVATNVVCFIRERHKAVIARLQLTDRYIQARGTTSQTGKIVVAAFCHTDTRRQFQIELEACDSLFVC